MDQEVRDGERDGTGSEASMSVVESKEVEDGGTDSTGSEASVGMVDESKEVRDSERDSTHWPWWTSPDQGLGPASMGVVDKSNKKLEEVLMMEPLPGVISALLRQHGRRRLAAVDRKLRSWQFIEFELRSLIASLRKLQVLMLDLGSDIIDSDRQMNDWLGDTLYKHLLLAGDGERTSRACCSAAQPHPYAGAGASLVGIEGALKSKQLRWFMAAGQEADSKTLKVMAMVGPAGVGKTTLSMEVYRQLQQTEGFQDTSLEEAGHDMLFAKINQSLQQKRYLVTIHNVWKEIDWFIIKNALPENNLGSRIIITTQLRSVAQFCCYHSADGLVHEVKPLGVLDSKRLLFKKAFGSEDSCPTENLEQVCDEILRRCEGIPLFIIGMAGWLHEQLQKKAQGTNYRMETVPKLLKQFEQALATIYDDLPYDLKVMLMYMRVFPEGYTFDKDTLIEKWIHQGMINCDIARKVLHELIDRNVVTRVAASSGHNLQVEEAYHWHVGYFMLQFLASKSAQFLASESADDDHGFVCTLDSLGAEGGKTELRRLSLHQTHPELQTLLRRMDLSRTRLLSVSGEVSQIPLDKFSHLVVLDLEGWQCFEDEDMLLVCKMFLLRYLSLRNVRGVSKLPPEIKELKHLMSLDIRQTSICELPSQLCELGWLEKLDLRSTKVSQLPQQFWKLQNLECLLVDGDGVAGNERVIEISEEIKRLENLKIVAVIDLTRCSPSLVDALGALNPVEIAITWSFHQCTDGRFQEALLSATRKWKRLQSLTIHCALGCRMDFIDFPPGSIPDYFQKFKMVDGRFASVPKWFCRLHDFTFIEITVCALLPGDLGILGKLENLECLVLGLHFIPEAALVIGAEEHFVHCDDRDQYDNYVWSFPRLRRLSVSCRVPWLTFTKGAMPALTFLELKIAGSPASQESVPSGITNLGKLSDVAIRFHANYTNSPSVKTTVEAVKKEIADHRRLINLFINDIEDQGEDFQAAKEGLPGASGRLIEIQNEDSSIGDQEEDVQAVEAGPASEIEELE
ncbi:unnamed protein product [Alopecurus aequalis]